MICFLAWYGGRWKSAAYKHFGWPEQKADASREAAFGYCDLKKLESEASLFRDYPRQPCKSSNLYKTHGSTISLAKPIKLWSEAVIKEILFMNGNRVYTPRVWKPNLW